MSTALRNHFLPFFEPEITEEEIHAVTESLRSGWLTTGPRVLAFEEAFARFTGATHAVALNSCTAALHLALEAIGLQPGEEVIVPTMTFAATAEVVWYFKARPVLVDCDPATLNLDPDQVASRLSEKTRAILPVHFAGQPCDLDRIHEIARAHGLAVIEDAAHALPAAWDGKTIGTLSDLTCFSFYANKTITTGEGGMVTTENAEYAERIRRMSLHGISKDAWKRYTAQGTWYYEILAAGYKYNLPDPAAALGLVQLKKAETFRGARERIARRYLEAFAEIPEVTPLEVNARARHAWHLFVVQLDLARLHIDRNGFIEELKRMNIGSSVHYMPLHLHPFYRDHAGCRPGDYPVATRAWECILSLPIYPRMSDADVEDVVTAVKTIVAKHRRSGLEPGRGRGKSLPA